MCDSSSVSSGDTSCYSTDHSVVIISERYVVDHPMDMKRQRRASANGHLLEALFDVKDESSTDYKNDGSSDLPSSA
jgi:hypothetical protein